MRTSFALVLVAVALLGSRGAAAASPQAAVALLLAQSLKSEGDLPGALGRLDEALREEPGEPYLELERARLLFELGQLDRASHSVAAARQRLPDELEALRLQGRIEMARAPEDPGAIAVALEALSELRARVPNDVEVLVSLGQIFLAGGQAELAVEVLDEALRQRPGNGWIDSLRNRAVRGLDDAAAERAQVELLRRDPNHLSARLELAERLGRAERHREALTLLEATPASQRDRPEVVERLARQLYLAGEIERALPVAERLLVDGRDGVPARRLLGRILVAAGEFARAEAVLMPIAHEATTDDLVAELLLRALEEQGEIDAAAALLEQRRAHWERSEQPRLARAAVLDLARLQLRHDRHEPAAELAAAVVAADDPELAGEAIAIRAQALVELGRYEDAIAFVAATPRAPKILTLELALAAGREVEAEREAGRLLAAEPQLRLRVAAAFQDDERWERAAELLEQVVAADPDSIEAAFRLAACSERLGRIERAVELFRLVLARAPRFAAALNYLGYLWIERGENLDEAVALVTEAVRLDPSSGAYVDSLGWGLFRLGRFAEAVRMLERASRLVQDDPVVLEHLGDARAAFGDRSGAESAYRRAVELDPKAAGVARKLTELGGGK